MTGWGSTTDRILLLLEQEPMTKAELSRRLDITHNQISAVLTRLQRKTPKYEKRIYISGYTRHAITGKMNIRPIFSLGNKPNKPRIKPLTQKERSKRAYEKLMSMRYSSIFRQTMTRRELNGL
jgi:transcriptional regulator with XRE-family HTH domain